MYRKILLFSVTAACSSCSVVSTSNQSLLSVQYQQINARAVQQTNLKPSYDELQRENLQNIKKQQPQIHDTEIENKVRNLTMDLLAKTDITEDTLIYVNPITVINVDSLPYAFERNQFINNLIITELRDYGITVIDDTTIDQELKLQNHVLVLDTQINKYQDMYYVNCHFKQAKTNKILSMVKTEIPFLLLENMRDGVTLLN